MIEEFNNKNYQMCCLKFSVYPIRFKMTNLNSCPT